MSNILNVLELGLGLFVFFVVDGCIQGDINSFLNCFATEEFSDSYQNCWYCHLLEFAEIIILHQHVINIIGKAVLSHINKTQN